MTEDHWKAAGIIFKQIHDAALPYQMSQSLRKETFDPTEYIRWVAAFEARPASRKPERPAERALYASWMAHRPAIQSTLTALERLAGELRGRTFPQVICHADLHPGNLLRDRAGRVFVIDWEDVMIAPKERDFIFVTELQSQASDVGQASGLSLPPPGAFPFVTELQSQASDVGQASSLSLPPPDSLPSPFFQGYGHAEIDQSALAYYRHERVVTDLIECARNVFFRDDLGEATKSDSAQLFDRILTGRALYPWR
jgi:spectinomycin phosphotransferase